MTATKPLGSAPSPTLADLDALRLESGRWLTLGVYGDETEARIEPFDVVPLNVASWWPPATSER